MLNLLKADLYRVFKDKLFIVALILGAALSILIPLGYFFITWGTTALAMSGASAQESLAYAKDNMASAYLFTKLISAPAMPCSRYKNKEMCRR